MTSPITFLDSQSGEFWDLSPKGNSALMFSSQKFFQKKKGPSLKGVKAVYNLGQRHFCLSEVGLDIAL